MSIPLPRFNRNQGNIGSAKSELKKARFELKEVEIQVQTILFRLKTELEVLASEIDILKNDIIPEAQAAYTLNCWAFLYLILKNGQLKNNN